jgi:uncharacterized membrane protein (DUF2068 family)
MLTVARGTNSALSARVMGPALLLIGGVTALLVTAAAAVYPDIATAGRPAYLASGLIMTSADLAVALGLAAVAVAAPLALGRLRTPVIALTVGASFGMVVAEAVLRADFATGNAIYGVVGPLQALGLIGLGVGIIRSRGWSSWRRFAVLAWGLYIPLLMVPLLVFSGGTSLVALAGYHIGVVAAGVAARQEFDRAEASSSD